MRGHRPPASTVRRCRSCQSPGNAPCAQRTKQRRASLILFDDEPAQTAVKPFVHVREHAGRVGETEVRLPSHQIASPQRHDLREAAAAVPGGDRPDALLHLLERLRRHATFDDLSWGIPEAVAKLYPRKDRSRAGAIALFAGFTRLPPPSRWSCWAHMRRRIYRESSRSFASIRMTTVRTQRRLGS